MPVSRRTRMPHWKQSKFRNPRSKVPYADVPLFVGRLLNGPW